MFEYRCPESDCGFLVRTENEYELFAVVETHAESAHGVWHPGSVIHERSRQVKAPDERR